MKALLITFTVSGVMSILIAIPLIERRIKPNPWYGFRVRATLENPDLWYAVNAHLGRRLLISGFITTLTALLLFVIPGLSLDTYALACGGIFVVSISVGLIQSARYLKQLSRSKPPMDF